ncbi:MAG: sulfite exporter TauE/SafE family protein [Steroidobacteraceae bacterium]
MTLQFLTFAYAASCIFVAAIVRGYSGFGFSMLAITSLSLLLPPVQIVPSIFLMELIASLHLLPGVWRDIHWRALSWLVVGCCFGTPLGVYALAHAPAAPMTLALAFFVLVSAILLGKGYEMKRMPGRGFTFAAGAASGLCNGGFGMGGPPVILFFFSSPAGVGAGRASLIAFFLLTDIVALGWQGWSGLITPATAWRAALFLPPLVAGVWIGNRSFKQADQSVVRRWILRLLMLLALLSGVRALSQLI